jgi:hypothetical protein
MVKNLFIFHGDLGAGKNILKNIVLLSEDVHFPAAVLDNRAEWLIKNIYKPESKIDWFKYEYTLKDYQKYGVEMIQGDANVDQILCLPPSLQFLLKSQNYAMDLFNKHRAAELVNLPYVKFLAVYPTTEQGLRWQIRAYAEKKIPEHMHNFTYIDQSLIEKHKSKYGVSSWTKVNLYNFYKDAENYVDQIKQKQWPMVPLEWLLDSSQWPILLAFLQDYFCVVINFKQAHTVLDAWTDLHWPISKTDEWEHIDIFDGFRTEFSDLVIRTHSCDL